MEKPTKRLSPLQAIHMYCVWCCNGLIYEVARCGAEMCPLWELRIGKGFKGMSPLKSIRLRCVDCYGGSVYLPKNCDDPECALYEFRLGKNPRLKGKGNAGVFRKQGKV